jgi:general stress protein 26
MSQKAIDRAVKVIAEKVGGGDEGHCVMALIDKEGYPTASTLSVSKADGIKGMTFCTGLDSNKAIRISDCNRASICFTSSKHNITLVGTVEVLTDPAIKKEMWYDDLGGVFTGFDDPNYCVLRFKTNRYSLFFTDDYENAVGTL